MFAVALAAVWLGVGRGLAPLEKLRAEIAKRSHRDLRPVDESQAPDEVRPMVRELNDLLGRRIDLMFPNLPPVIGQIKAGRLRALAVTSGKRLPSLPEVPAIAESVPGFVANTWYGVVVPARTPPAIVQKLNAALTRAGDSAEVRERLSGLGFELATSTPEALGRYIAAEDSGTSVEDMKYMTQFTRHVAGIVDKPSEEGMRSGDPSPATAYGTFIGIKAAAKERLGRDSLEGLRVAVQGVGNVGFDLARQLKAAGAELWVTDIHRDALTLAAKELGATVVAPEAIFA